MIPKRKESRADRTSEHEPVARHPAKPVGRYQPQMLTVERPFVEGDLNGTAADEDTDGDEQTQAPALPERQLHASMTTRQEEK